MTDLMTDMTDLMTDLLSCPKASKQAVQEQMTDMTD